MYSDSTMFIWAWEALKWAFNWQALPLWIAIAWIALCVAVIREMLKW